jgi:hypothetical protein
MSCVESALRTLSEAKPYAATGGGEWAWNLAGKSGETVNGQGMIVGVGKGRTHRVRGCYVTVYWASQPWRLPVARINNG